MSILNNVSSIKLGSTTIDAVYLGNNSIWSSVAPNMVVEDSGWTPTNLGSSLALWLDADDASTITLNGSSVSQWGDKSANGFNVSQINAAQQPSYTLNSLNGRPGIDWGSIANNKTLTITGIDYSPVRYFGVADYDGPDPFTLNATLIGHSFTNTLDRIGTNTSGSNWSHPTTCFLNGAASSSNIALPTINNHFIFATNNGPNPSRSEIYLGASQLGGQRAWIGKIYEIISVNTTPSTEERNIIEGYLAHKWGLTENLPTDHPYKISPPQNT